MVSCKVRQEFTSTTRAFPEPLQSIWQSVVVEPSRFRATTALLRHEELCVEQILSARYLLRERSLSSDNVIMTGNEFIRKVKAYGKKQGIAVTLNASRGKGSHQTLYFGSAFTVVRNPKDELKTGTFHGMCSQLGIKPSEL